MHSQDPKIIFREPVPLSEGGYPGFNPRTERAKRMIIERGVAAAINPWEGVSDFYREFSYHGGIPED
jgi:hypothetical protein